MNAFEPDFRNLEMAARNQTATRLPLYEHSVSDEIMETILNKKFSTLGGGNYADKVEYFKWYCEFFLRNGYDTVSIERGVGPVMPGSGSLGGHVKGVIQTMEDFQKYPWEEIPEYYFRAYADDFRALRQAMPDGMKAVGGVGYGIFECVQDITGYMALCLISEDDPDLYAQLFQKVGQTNLAIWKRFMKEFGDIFCVLRFGDDLGYKANTLLSHDDIRSLILPEYTKIISVVHQYDKPFLLHSCGCIFDVFEDILLTGIDAKHSNEDEIALFPVWVERYGDRIGNFGGIDMDALCRLTPTEIREYILDVLKQVDGKGGIAFGSGNSIPKYVPPEGYLAMIETIRTYRGA
jgi:uroporphyrinogen decarboxylase